MEVKQIMELMTPEYHSERARLSEEARRRAFIVAAKKRISTQEIAYETPLDNNQRLRAIGAAATNDSEILLTQQ